MLWCSDNHKALTINQDWLAYVIVPSTPCTSLFSFYSCIHYIRLDGLPFTFFRCDLFIWFCITSRYLWITILLWFRRFLVLHSKVLLRPLFCRYIILPLSFQIYIFSLFSYDFKYFDNVRVSTFHNKPYGFNKSILQLNLIVHLIVALNNSFEFKSVVLSKYAVRLPGMSVIIFPHTCYFRSYLRKNPRYI